MTTVETIKEEIANTKGYNSFNKLLESESTENISITVSFCMREFSNVKLYELRKELIQLYTYDIRTKKINKGDLKLFNAAPLLLEAALDFVNKVDEGRARSTDSYNKFKNAINKAIGQT